jgi:segregation and condensation protein A
MQSIDDLVQLAEKDRRHLFTLNLAEIVKKTLRDVNESNGFETSNAVLILSILVKLKSELLLLIFNLESFAKSRRIKEFEDDQEVVEIFSALEKSFSTKAFEKPNYFEIEKGEDIPFAKLSRIVKEILEREKLFEQKTLQKNDISINDVTESLKERILGEKSISFEELLQNLTSRIEIVVTFLVVLILAKNKFIFITQEDAFAPIYLKLYEKRRVPLSD